MQEDLEYSDDEGGDLEGEVEVEEVPEVFGGDFFGNDYVDEDFPGWDEQDEEHAVAEVEDEEEERYAYYFSLMFPIYAQYL